VLYGQRQSILRELIVASEIEPCELLEELARGGDFDAQCS